MKQAFIALLLMPALYANSQTIVGIKTGLNIANLKYSNNNTSYTYDPRVGFYGGFYFTIPSNRNFSIQPEIVYSLEGAELDPIDANLNLHYINIPIMFQYNAKSLVVEAGPQIGVLISASALGNELTNDYEKVNVALGLGLGYKLRDGFGLSGRYNLGLTDISDDNRSNQSLKSNVFQLGITYALGKVKRRR